MILFGDIFNEVVWAAQMQRNPEGLNRITRRLNMDLRAICARESWADLRREATYTWDGSTPIQLPSNLVGIDMVWDDAHEIEYLPRNTSASERFEYVFRYHTYPVGSTLAEVEDGEFAQDEKVMSSAALGALVDAGLDVEGEYFYVGGSDQLYLMGTRASGSIFNFTPGFRGYGSVSGGKVTVRPQGTRMLKLVSDDLSWLPTTEINVHYWVWPDSMRDPEDIVPLPTADVLLFRTLARTAEARKLRPVSQSQVNEALREALALNPDKPGPRKAHGLHGREIAVDDRLYRSPGDGEAAREIEYRLRNIWET